MHDDIFEFLASSALAIKERHPNHYLFAVSFTARYTLEVNHIFHSPGVYHPLLSYTRSGYVVRVEHHTSDDLLGALETLRQKLKEFIRAN